MLNRYIILLTFLSLAFPASAALTAAGQGATWQMQICSADGNLICLTGVNNYVVGDKRYDVTFQYGVLDDLFPEFADLSVSNGNTTLDNGPLSLRLDAAQFLFDNWNRDYLSFNSDIRATFATPDLSYINDVPTLITNIRWTTWLLFPQGGWLGTEFNEAVHLTSYPVGRDISIPARYSDPIHFGADPEHAINLIYPNPDFYMIATVTTVPVPAASWLLASALIGLAGSRRKK